MRYIIILTFLLTNSFKISAQLNSTVFNSDSIFINGKLEVFTTKKLLTQYLGDNIKKEMYEPECGLYADKQFINVKFSYYSKNGISFLVYKNKADLNEINLSKDNFVNFGRFKVDKNTSLVDLKNIFKKSYNNFIKDYKNDKKETKYFFILNPCKTCEDEIQIILDKNLKVKSIKYWSPC